MSKSSSGKYADVLLKYGKAGFGIPEKAPYEGSFPVYPLSRAQYAIAIVTGPVYDNKRADRDRVMAAAYIAHGDLVVPEIRRAKATIKKREDHQTAQMIAKKYPEYSWIQGAIQNGDALIGNPRKKKQEKLIVENTTPEVLASKAELPVLFQKILTQYNIPQVRIQRTPHVPAPSHPDTIIHLFFLDTGAIRSEYQSSALDLDIGEVAVVNDIMYVNASDFPRIRLQVINDFGSIDPTVAETILRVMEYPARDRKKQWESHKLLGDYNTKNRTIQEMAALGYLSVLNGIKLTEKGKAAIQSMQRKSDAMKTNPKKFTAKPGKVDTSDIRVKPRDPVVAQLIAHRRFGGTMEDKTAYNRKRERNKNWE